jgi:catechol 2,3-dioxygenase-like lactoylglutathione lyase family enzyme
MHLTVPNAEEAAQWYIKNMGCQAAPNRTNAAQCGTTLFLFFVRTPTGPSVGTGINHIGFSFADLPAKVKSLEAAGVKITTPVTDIPNLFKYAYGEDPWGTRIEFVEHPEYPGFHHVHLNSVDPAKTREWYHNVFGGEITKMKGRIDAVLYDKIWLLVGASKEPLLPSEGRSIDHLGFSLPDLDAGAAEIKQKGITFQSEPRAITPPSPVAAKVSFIIGPDNVRIEVVEPPKK